MTRTAGGTAGWFADPAGRFRFRYWTGAVWTDQVLSGTSREESTDPLEVEFQGQPPRPVLPTTAATEDAASLARGVSPESGAGASRVRIPRPGRLLVALLVGAGAAAALTVLLLSVLPKGHVEKSASPEALVKRFSSSSPFPALAAQSNPGDASQATSGFRFSSVPALPGYREVSVDAPGVSLPIPDLWLVSNPQASSTVRRLEQAGFDTNTAEFRSWKLYASAGGPTATQVFVTMPGYDPLLLRQPEAVLAELRLTPGVVASGVHVTSTRVAGLPGLLIELPVTTTGIDGSAHLRYTTSYAVSGPHGVVSVDFIAETDGVQDPTIQTIASHLKLTK